MRRAGAMSAPVRPGADHCLGKAGCQNGNFPGPDAAVVAPLHDHDDLALEVRHLGARLCTLTQEVGTIEARQVALDRRLVEFGSLVQGLQEEQYTQSCALERSQKALATGAQRALHKAVAVQQHLEQEDEWQTCLDRVSASGIGQLERRWEARLEEHTRWLMELQSDMAAMSMEALPSKAPASGALTERAARSAAAREAPLATRLTALERAQRTIAVSTRRALHTALVVHQQQRSHEQDDDCGKARLQAPVEECVDVAKPVADLERECKQRFSEQDERLDKILQMVDTLADRVLLQALPDEANCIDDRALARDMREHAGALSELREKLDELEANTYGLASQIQAQQHQQQSTARGLSDMAYNEHYDSERVLVVVENLEQRVDRSLSDVCQRLDFLQEGRDQHRITLRQLSNELPEVSQKLDQLWTQCQYYFPRVKEHDVHFSFFRTSFENHKQHMLDFTGGLERPRAGERCQTALFPTPPPHEATRLSAPAADDRAGGPGPGPGGGLHPGAGPGAAAEGADEGPRAQMLAQVMARLYSDQDWGPPGGAFAGRSLLANAALE